MKSFIAATLMAATASARRSTIRDLTVQSIESTEQLTLDAMTFNATDALIHSAETAEDLFRITGQQDRLLQLYDIKFTANAQHLDVSNCIVNCQRPISDDFKVTMTL